MTGKRTGRHAGGVARRGMSRREFLKVGGAGLVGASMLGAAGCGGSSGGSGDLVFAMGRDTTSTLPKLIDGFNKQNKGNFQVKYRVMPTASDQYFDQLRTELQAGSSSIDVIGADVIWPAQFAAQGWILDVSDRFSESDRQAFLSAPVNSLIYEGAIYGVPWYTDAGMLYYRKDLLEDAGFSEPPKTWDELKEIGLKTSKDTGTKYGFVFQGSQYEGGTVNGLEYIWTNGGDVLKGNKVVIDSPESVEGLATELSMVTDGVAPQAVSTYTELETDPAFLNGDSVFARNWPYMYALAGTSDYPKVKPEQIDVAPLPKGPGGEQTSSVGGWNIVINATSDKQDQAWEFIRWMTAPEQMKLHALEGSRLPTRKSLYDDQEILSQVPVIRLGKEAITKTTARPVSPYYSDMSLEMAEQFNSVLNGDTTPEDAISSLQEQISSIQEQAQ